ncbi:unnamed protein product [Nyctereutes procyonoides]|uniref:(raccoon dog) hypothetical protein n=1 Tax=Nyctereutes procyonoides TaxID=34880 RepID=A0A811Y427_NYCPR|nr:unnamed protein product [Nyctereutes procyonoides]
MQEEKRDGGEAGGVLDDTLPHFPVAMFWIANQAEWFEDYVIQRKRELWPPEKEDQRRELEEFKERIRKQREEKLLRAAQQSS